MAKNPFGKTVTKDKAYAVYSASGGQWVTYVLKMYQAPEAAAKNPFARAFTLVVTPYVGPSGELGDTYLKDIPGTLISGVDVRGGKSA